MLRRRDGHLTRDLLREPGGFGLGQVPARLKPDATAELVCGYCSTGCGLTVHLKAGEPVSLTPAPDYPVNRGTACPKGWEALAVLAAADRARSPLLRDAAGVRRAVDWDAALRAMVERFRAIQAQHGPESVAFLSTGQMPTEEMALLGSLAKFGMGMVHGDGNTRQCMATSVVAYKQAFGFDAPPYTYRDFEQSDVIVLVGANLCIAHPIMWERVLQNPHDPAIVVIDPRVTETAMQASQHLPLRPKSDQALFYGLAHLLIERGWIDRGYVAAHTRGFDEYAAAVAPFSIQRTSAETGLPPADIERLAATIHAGKRVSFWWTMGVNQSYQGVRTAQSIINLALITGNMGRPGTGANSITGQCNAMGSRLFSNTTKPAGRPRLRESGAPRDGGAHAGSRCRGRSGPQQLGLQPHHRRDPARGDQGPLDCRHQHGALLDQPGPGAGHTRPPRLSRRPGHVRLDRDGAHGGRGAAGRRLGREGRHLHQLGAAHRHDPQGGPPARPGVAGLRHLQAGGRVLGLRRDVPRLGVAGCRFPDPQAPVGRPAVRHHRHRRLRRAGGAGRHPVAVPRRRAAPRPRAPSGRLFEDGRFYHPDGRARLLFEMPRPLPEPATDRFPLILLTGRGSAAQWHTQTRTSKSAILRKLYPPRIYVEINPDDAKARGIGANDSVHVESRRGRIAAKAFVTHSVQRGHVFIPMHYEAANRLTDAVFDPYSKQPSYKACAVELRRAAAAA